MPRNMSFALTTEQVRNKTKTVTRRNGWGYLKQGDIVNAVVKCMGLKKGQKVDKICQIRVVNVSLEKLNDITWEECKREGFPELLPCQFVKMFCNSHKGVTPNSRVVRIEFNYI